MNRRIRIALLVGLIFVLLWIVSGLLAMLNEASDFSVTLSLVGLCVVFVLAPWVARYILVKGKAPNA